MKHILFPISVSNEVFSSDNTFHALAALPPACGQITFLIADRIQVYNDIANASADLAKILSLDWSGRYRNDLLQRRRWLERLRTRLPDAGDRNWQVIGVSDTVDAQTYVALRSVWLLYRIDPKFTADVDEAVDDFMSRRRSPHPQPLVREMALGYILEEVAINARLRVLRNLRDEYYMGETLPVLPRLYAGAYMKSPEELLGKPKKPAGAYRFWEWSDGAWRAWTDTPAPSRKLRLVSGA